MISLSQFTGHFSVKDLVVEKSPFIKKTHFIPLNRTIRAAPSHTKLFSGPKEMDVSPHHSLPQKNHNNARR